MQEIADAAFDTEVLASSHPVLVDFWAPWCVKCKAMAPAIAQLAEEHAEDLRVVTMDVEQNPATAARLGVISLPALKLFVGGEVVKSWTGAMPGRVFEAEVVAALATR